MKYNGVEYKPLRSIHKGKTYKMFTDYGDIYIVKKEIERSDVAIIVCLYTHKNESYIVFGHKRGEQLGEQPPDNMYYTKNKDDALNYYKSLYFELCKKYHIEPEWTDGYFKDKSEIIKYFMSNSHLIKQLGINHNYKEIVERGIRLSEIVKHEDGTWSVGNLLRYLCEGEYQRESDALQKLFFIAVDKIGSCPDINILWEKGVALGEIKQFLDNSWTLGNVETYLKG